MVRDENQGRRCQGARPDPSAAGCWRRTAHSCLLFSPLAWEVRGPQPILLGWPMARKALMLQVQKAGPSGGQSCGVADVPDAQGSDLTSPETTASLSSFLLPHPACLYRRVLKRFPRMSWALHTSLSGSASGKSAWRHGGTGPWWLRAVTVGVGGRPGRPRVALTCSCRARARTGRPGSASRRGSPSPPVRAWAPVRRCWWPAGRTTLSRPGWRW